VQSSRFRAVSNPHGKRPSLASPLDAFASWLLSVQVVPFLVGCSFLICWWKIFKTHFLRSKWLAIGVLVLFFWTYEFFDLWETPWWTAWIIIFDFAAAPTSPPLPMPPA
jgi:hypothetical protein